ncbi:MAG TPA: lipopolysaccharide kinase InaA family protein [Planctomycetaceae bacterium]|nr:lipopolysaccharide kinase InaA family protein [Planctomycetaceae bacterium]
MMLRTPAFRPACAGVAWGSDAARALLEHNGLADVDRVFSRFRPDRWRHAGRAVVEAALPSPGGGERRVFVKLSFGRRRWWPRMADLKTGQFWQSLPLREWRGIERLEALGLFVPERIGLYGEGLWRSRAAVIVGAVPAPHSIDELLRSGRWRHLDRPDREFILEEVVAAARRIHAAGLAWRGICSRHFFPVRQPDGRWRLWLIDLEGLHRRRGSRPVERDFSKLLRAMQASGADAETLEVLAAKINARPAAPMTNDQ